MSWNIVSLLRLLPLQIVKYLLDKLPALLAIILTFAVAIGWPQLKFNNSPHIKVSLLEVDYEVSDRGSLPISFTPISYSAKLLVFNDGNRASFISGFSARIDEMTPQERSFFNQKYSGIMPSGANFRDYFALPSFSSPMTNWIENYEHSEAVIPFIVKPDDYRVVDLKGVLAFENGKNSPSRDRPVILGFKIDYYNTKGNMQSKSIPGAIFNLYASGNGPRLHSDSIRYSNELRVIMP